MRFFGRRFEFLYRLVAGRNWSRRLSLTAPLVFGTVVDRLFEGRIDKFRLGFRVFLKRVHRPFRVDDAARRRQPVGDFLIGQLATGVDGGHGLRQRRLGVVPIVAKRVVGLILDIFQWRVAVTELAQFIKDSLRFSR